MSALLRAWIAISLASGILACIDPKDQRPGLRLRGEVASELPSDWLFSNEYKEIAIEVSTPYLVPHSVTIWCAAADEQLYLGARNPETKRWPGWVEQDPNARLRIGEQVYEVKLSVIDDPKQISRVRRAYAAKYELPDPAPQGGPPMRYWRVEPRT
jgi:hypothetical protein